MRTSDSTPYDASIHWTVTDRCNFSCAYCVGAAAPPFDPKPIDVPRLLDALDATGRTFLVRFTGGEPTLVPNFPQAVRAISERRYVAIISNLSTAAFDETLDLVPSERLLRVVASFHYDELLRRGLLDAFARRVARLRSLGVPTDVEAVATPDKAPLVEEIADAARRLGFSFRWVPYFGTFDGERYPEAYDADDLRRFGVSEERRSVFFRKGTPCNAGVNAFVAYSNGDAYPCHQIKRKIGNVYEEISFADRLTTCPSRRCGCPLPAYDPPLMEKARALVGE